MGLAFDAGGSARQEDIWVGDLTEQEAKEFLALRGHKNDWKDFVDACVSAQFNKMLIDYVLFGVFKFFFLRGTLTRVLFRWLADWRLGESLREVEVPSLNR